VVDTAGLAAGTYAATNIVTSPTGTNSPVLQSVVLTVHKADQTIDFPAIPQQEHTNHVALAATASSGRPVSFAVASGPGLLDAGTNLSFTAPGVVVVVASEGGGPDWNPAPDVSNTVVVVAVRPWPAGGVTVTNRSPTLYWAATSGASWYYLWISRDGEKYYGSWLKGMTDWTAGFDMQGGAYEWWVQPWDGTNGYGAWSDVSVFVIPVMVPGKATLLAPAGSIATNPPTFTWQPVEHASWYYLWLDRGEMPVLRQWVKGAANHVPGHALAFGSYRWWVRTWNVDGYGPWSAPMALNVGVPVPVSPSGVQAVPPTQLVWNDEASASATWYHLWVNRNGSPHWEAWVKRADTSDAGGGLRSAAVPVALPADAYQWWIQAWSLSGYGPWSTALPFTVQGSSRPSADE
jgi:hypothetical protein